MQGPTKHPCFCKFMWELSQIGNLFDIQHRQMEVFTDLSAGGGGKFLVVVEGSSRKLNTSSGFLRGFSWWA
eukprot:CAMPEP_0204497568 /NCGR_PEP_ID=MMETSP0471-20130131/91099_1 /ASSEMBLY_ACC=CAM_ASM_000602 /TAXON_ID=2969 /ORGANISM="Oxyrrhis marina" /LENGTH=70 /DNA_ID=CAMNT_0051501979 /DNA_START=116 /DNA_END=324 /DNA_ORIENTATION=+